MKTKSTIFMIAYVVILFVAPIIGIFVNESIITTLALAATVAGMFFAIADLFSNLSDEWKRQESSCEKELREAESLCNKIKYMYEQLHKKAEDKMQITRNDISKQQLTEIKARIEKALTKLKKKFYNKAGQFKHRNESKQLTTVFSILSIFLFATGTAVFVLICIIPGDWLVFAHRQELFSIYGCAFVFLNYLITDTAEDRIKNHIKKYKTNISKFKESKKKLDKTFKESNSETTTSLIVSKQEN